MGHPAALVCTCTWGTASCLLGGGSFWIPRKKGKHWRRYKHTSKVYVPAKRRPRATTEHKKKGGRGRERKEMGDGKRESAPSHTLTHKTEERAKPQRTDATKGVSAYRRPPSSVLCREVPNERERERENVFVRERGRVALVRRWRGGREREEDTTSDVAACSRGRRVRRRDGSLAPPVGGSA